jgi:hypothetical protein
VLNADLVENDAFIYYAPNPKGALSAALRKSLLTNQEAPLGWGRRIRVNYTPTIWLVSWSHTFSLRQAITSFMESDVRFTSCNSGMLRITSGRR